MKALIAFIVMAVGILILIEINERVKAKKKAKGEGMKEDCPKETSGKENCSDCSLIDLCDKKPEK